MGFWKGKKIFITGHTGFKGSWLSLWLNMLGAEVTGYALEAEKQCLFRSAQIAKYTNSIIGDVGDPSHLSAELKSCQPEIVFHMAAQSLVRSSYLDPTGTFFTNVIGTVNVLESVRHASSVRAVVVVTSDKCYDNKEWVWGYRENDPMGGYDPYSASKGCAELAANAFQRSFFQGSGQLIATARAGNVIGGGDWSADRILPDIVRALSKGDTVYVRNPNATRPWQHVCEPLHGYLTLGQRLCSSDEEYTGGWNFGPDDEGARTVSWLVDYVCREWGHGANWKVDSGDHPHEANYLKLDCSKAKIKLGWRPQLDVTTALDWTVEWYTKYLAGEAAKDLTEKQILRYQGLCKNE